MRYVNLEGRDWEPVFGREFLFELDKRFAYSNKDDSGAEIVFRANAGLTSAILGIQTFDIQTICIIIQASLSMEKSRPSNDAIYDYVVGLGADGIVELCDSFFEFLTTDHKLKELVKLLGIMQERLATRGVRMN